jgi:hypothetical protein
MHHSLMTLPSGEYRITQCGESWLAEPVVPGGDPHGPDLICPLCHGVVRV